jgi:hypothetical protein
MRKEHGDAAAFQLQLEGCRAHDEGQTCDFRAMFGKISRFAGTYR